MKKAPDESGEIIITRLRNEIIPLLKSVISTGDGLTQKYEDCLACRVFRDSCPTIVEELGEHLNNLSLLLNNQREQAVKDSELIALLRHDLAEAVKKIQDKEKEIQELMITDKLTTLYNRQHLITVLEDEIARCQRYGRPLSLLLIDIDGFRSLNDAYGHDAGDHILSFVGALIKESTRKFDRAFRYGGEEFVVVLPESDLTMAYIVAERIRKGCEHDTMPEGITEDEVRESISCSVSIGVTATFAYGTEEISIDELMSQTEKAMTEAKDGGGNMCIRYE